MSANAAQTSTDAAVGAAVCRLTDLVPNRGVAALVDGEQVALFRVADEVFAVQQLDPYSGAYIMSRGLVGTRRELLTVAGPMYKQVFDLRTGECIDPVGEPLRHLRTWQVRTDDDGLVILGPCELELP